jgi:hypothetical protein
MSAFRVFDPNPVYWNNLVTEPLRGGFLQFYDIGTTTPKDTWSDADLTVLNTNPIELDGFGRSPVNIFGDGDYTVRCTDAAGVLQWTRDVISGQTAGQTIPPLDTGEFLTNDGSNLLWQAIRQVPDPTGQNGKYLSTDGTALLWAAIATVAANAIITFPASNTVKISSGTQAFLIQWGTGTIPNNGTTTSSVVLSFPTAFSGIPFVAVTPTNRPNGSGGATAMLATSISTSGALVIGDTNGFINITVAVGFTWLAIGPVAA